MTTTFIGSPVSAGGVLTAFEISLQIIKQVLDTMPGTATAGATTYLTDTTNITQTDGYWDRGTLWIQGGTHAGKCVKITTHATNKVNFATLGTAIEAGNRYTLARGAYPLEQIYTAINAALDETYIEADDDTLEGDGETLAFTLPTGVYDIKRVEFEIEEREDRPRSTHWREKGGRLVFDYGHAPYSGDVIHVIYRDKHGELTTYSDTLNAEINREWLVLAAARELLYWGASKYGKEQEYMIEERMNKVMNLLKGKQPWRGGVDVVMKTA